MTFNHLTGITISALLHAGLVSIAMVVSNEPIKKPALMEKVILTVNMFQNEVIPPPKPAPLAVKPTIVKSTNNNNIKPAPPIKVAPVVAIVPKTPKIKPEHTPIVTKAVTKIVTKKVPKKTMPSKVKVVKKKAYKKPAKKLVRKNTLKPIRKVVNKTEPHKIVKRKPILKKIPKKVARKATIKVQRRPAPLVKKGVKARKLITSQRTKPTPRYVKNAKNTSKRTFQKTARAPVKYTQKTNKRPSSKHIPTTAKTATRKPAQNANLSKQYKAQLQRLIASKKPYPKRAKRRGQQGRVTLTFTVTHSGNISNIRVVKGARDNDLNIAAVKAIKQTSGKLRYPNGMNKKSLTLTITLSYVLS